MQFKSTCTRAAVVAGSSVILGGSSASAADTPKLEKVRLVYVGGQDDPVAIMFTTSTSPGTQANGMTIRARAAILGSSSSVHHLGSKQTCFVAPASTRVVKKLKAGNKYKVQIWLGPESSAKTYSRAVTLKRGTLAGARHDLDC